MTKLNKKALGAALALAALSACSAMKVSSEKSPGADLSHYRTYSWTDASHARTQDSALDQNIRASLDDELRKNGFIPVAPDAKPDFLIDYSVSSKEKMQYAPGNTGMGVSGPYWHGYMAVPPTVETYREGSLIVDFFDGRSKTAFWRGSAEAPFSSKSEALNAVQEAAQKIVAEYRKDEAPAANA